MAKWNTKRIALIGVPLHQGSGRRGTELGPSAVRAVGLQSKLERLGHKVKDRGNIPIPARSADAIAACNQALCQKVYGNVSGGSIPIIIGGDHSLAVGSVSGVSKAFGAEPIGLIWVDAHGDTNTPETSPTGNVHGMPLAALLGLGDASLTSIGGPQPKVKPEHVVLIGARSLDPEETETLRRLGVNVFSMHEIDRHGICTVMKQAIALVKQETSGVHLSFDVDVLDPQYAPGVGTPVPGGLNVRECRLAMEMLGEAGMLAGVDLVEINPLLDMQGKTVSTAVDLITYLFGNRLF